MEIAAWLKALDLERYIEAFESNDIDPSLLRKLNAADLRELGVASLGHRKKLLEAIVALGDSPSQPAPAGSREAERRQLTVMFCDLVGSTALSARLDPEDMAGLMRGYHASCSETVVRWDGHVAKFMGDGVLAYFGYPYAREDGAERAVRAALELVSSIPRIAAAGQPLAVRVGIATGLVMVGEVIGEGTAQEQAVVGETPNLAARLQALAAPDEVVISHSTRRLVGRLFELANLGPQRLKGFAESLPAWRVEGEGRAEDRFEALHGQHLTPLVGRSHELEMLIERWSRAKDGEGQVVLISGEPGIGKSRLLRALRQELGGEPHTVRSHYCSPHHANSAFHPIITQLERAAAFASGDEPSTRRAKLASLLRQATATNDAVTLLAALLGLAASDHSPLDLTPQRRKQRTLEVLVEQLSHLARHRPVVDLYEDLHWVDPSTLELLDLLVERVRALPVLMVLTCRPEFSPRWTGSAHVTFLTLNRLGRRQGATIVERISGNKSLPGEALDQIVAKADGVPLFVEELTKTVLESGLLIDAGDRYDLSGPLPSLAIPATLHDSLMARLDRLAPVKEVAQMAAVIGREFRHDLLVALAPLPEPELDAALDGLVEAELVFRRGTRPEVMYTFKHALVQDAAYQSLLKSRRRQLHAQVAEILESQFPEIATSEPEVLARHCTAAGNLERAARYWRHAGVRASERFAYVEAIHNFETALRLVDDLPPSAARDRHELVLWLALGPALLSQGRWSAPKVGEAYQRARELGRRVGEPAELFAAAWGLWLHRSQSGHHEAARRLTEELIALAQKHGDAEMLLQAHHAAWTTFELLGDAVSCRQHVRRGIELYRADQHHAHVSSYGGHDPGVCARVHEAGTLWQLGYPDQALRSANDALTLARQLAHPSTLVIAIYYLATVHWWRREAEAAARCAEEVIAFCRQHDIPRNLGPAKVMRGWESIVDRGNRAGIADIEEGMADLEIGGPELRRVDCLIMLVEARKFLSEFDLARNALQQAQAFISKFGLRRSAPEVMRLEGDVLLVSSEAEQTMAEACFHKALAMARDQQAKGLELRAATSLARLWADQGERQKAHDLLAAVHAWFTEGFDTADLKDAKMLLDALR